jgi:WD repeat and SOF domain-containing protein 1
VRFNPAEPDLFATAGSDRGIALYDLRASTPVRKLVMQTRSNAIAWNPMEAFNFTVANEDCNLYTYDMRHLDSASCVHQDFVSAVMDVDYSPTGREFVAGGYDRSGAPPPPLLLLLLLPTRADSRSWVRLATACSGPLSCLAPCLASIGPAPPPSPPAVRIFSFNGGHSRDVYHTKRMQRVFAVRFSGDGTYVFSGEGLGQQGAP